MHQVVVVASLFLSFGCKTDAPVRPPEQQATSYLGQPLGSFVAMNQPDATRYFVSGIFGLEAQTWRWTGREAKLRLRLNETENMKYVMKFAVPGPLIAANGPVRISIRINDTNFDELRYAKDGVYEVEKPVPSRLLKADAENIVAVEVDKPLPGQNGPELGLILVHAGFRPQS